MLSSNRKQFVFYYVTVASSSPYSSSTFNNRRWNFSRARCIINIIIIIQKKTDTSSSMINNLFRRGYLLSYHYLWCVSFRIAVTLLGLQFFFRRGYDPFGLAARFLFYLFLFLFLTRCHFLQSFQLSSSSSSEPPSRPSRLASDHFQLFCRLIFSSLQPPFCVVVVVIASASHSFLNIVSVPLTFGAGLQTWPDIMVLPLLVPSQIASFVVVICLLLVVTIITHALVDSIHS